MATRQMQANRWGSETLELGEGPMWHAGEAAFYWFDVSHRRLYRRTDGAGEAESWPLEKMPGCFGWRAGGGVVFAFRNGLFIADRPQGPFMQVATPGVDFTTERFNDGKVDRRGRFWVGSFNPRFEAGGGSLLRIDPDLSVHRMDTGVTMSNGMGWSPDDRTMYFADSRPGVVWRYGFDADSGTIGERQTFLDYTERPGRPDGLTVDSEGGIWIAEVTAGQVVRYLPDGTRDRVVPLPASRPTSLTFGGTGLTTVIVTSMRVGLSEADLAGEQEAGGLFRFESDVPGLAEPLFAG